MVCFDRAKRRIMEISNRSSRMPIFSSLDHCNCLSIDSVGRYLWHYSDVTMSAMASQITSFRIVYSTVYSGTYQRTYQSSASCTGLCAGNSPVTGEFPAQKASKADFFSFDDVVMAYFTKRNLLKQHRVWGWSHFTDYVNTKHRDIINENNIHSPTSTMLMVEHVWVITFHR